MGSRGLAALGAGLLILAFFALNIGHLVGQDESLRKTKALAAQAKALAKQGEESHRALCKLEANLRQSAETQRAKIARTEGLLRRNGASESIFGIPTKLIEQGLETDRAALARTERNVRDLQRILGCRVPRPDGRRR